MVRVPCPRCGGTRFEPKLALYADRPDTPCGECLGRGSVAPTLLDELLEDLPALRHAQARDELESEEARQAYLSKYGYLPIRTRDVRDELRVLLERAMAVGKYGELGLARGGIRPSWLTRRSTTSTPTR